MSPTKLSNLSKYNNIYPKSRAAAAEAAAGLPTPGRRMVFCIHLVYLVHICIYFNIFGYMLSILFFSSLLHGYGTGLYMSQRHTEKVIYIYIYIYVCVYIYICKIYKYIKICVAWCFFDMWQSSAIHSASQPPTFRARSRESEYVEYGKRIAFGSARKDNSAMAVNIVPTTHGPGCLW